MTRIASIVPGPLLSTVDRKDASRADAPSDFVVALRDLLAAAPVAKPVAKAVVPVPIPVPVDAAPSEPASGQVVPAAVPPGSGGADPLAVPPPAADAAALVAVPPESALPDRILKSTLPLQRHGVDGVPIATPDDGKRDPSHRESVDTNVAQTATVAPPAPQVPAVTAAMAMAMPMPVPMPVPLPALVANPTRSDLPSRSMTPIMSTNAAISTVGAAVSGAGDAGLAAVAAPAIVTVDARWRPPKKTDAAPAADPGADAATPGATAPPADVTPLPDELASLVAAVVRQVTRAGGGAPTALHGHRESGGSAKDADVRDEAARIAPVVVHSSDAPAYAPVPAARSGDQGAVKLPDTPDAGPRLAPEPKAAPAPTAHATLELDADKTGASRIRIAVQGSQVRATITATEIGIASLDRQLPELRRSLEERGFSDIRLAVRAQEHAGAAAPAASSGSDDARSFARHKPDSPAQRSTQHDTGDRAGSQRRRRDPEENA